jgi:Domain of unknown function DUF1828
MDIRSLEKSLCSSFCESITVNAIPSGLAVSAFLTDQSNDRIGFYVIEDADGIHLEDDGDYLSRLIAQGVEIDKGSRANFIESVLSRANAYVDPDTYEIKTHSFASDQIIKYVPDFLGALFRIRGVEYWTQDRVASTFKEDVYNALLEKLGSAANVSKDEIVDSAFQEFPCDIVLSPKKEGKKTAVFTVSSNEKLTEALALKLETIVKGRDDIVVAAVIEAFPSPHISFRKYQRAVNRSVAFSIYQGEEDAAINRIIEASSIKIIKG